MSVLKPTTVRIINLPCYKITVELTSKNGRTFGHISSNLCDDVDEKEDEEYIIAIDAIESFILSVACNGFDIENHAFIDAIETSVDAIANKYL